MKLLSANVGQPVWGDPGRRGGGSGLVRRSEEHDGFEQAGRELIVD